jgi:hypothetical protein
VANECQDIRAIVRITTGFIFYLRWINDARIARFALQHNNHVLISGDQRWEAELRLSGFKSASV